MVGKRSAFNFGKNEERTSLSRKGTYYDEENGKAIGAADDQFRTKPKGFKFREAARTALEDKRREELKTAILTDMGWNLEKFRKSDDELKAIKNKQVRKYYEEQNERVNDWLEVDGLVKAVADDILDSMNPDPDHDGVRERTGGVQDMAGEIGEFLPKDVREERQDANKKARWAINVNVIANIILLVGKLIAVVSSGSLSLVASTVDSTLDLLCTAIVWVTNRLVSWQLGSMRARFPVGRKRLEPIGILVFSIIMVISFMQILKESVEKLMPLEGTPESLSTLAIAALVSTVAVKGVIWFGCIPIKTTQVQALAQDCKTDVIFNTLSLLFPLIGDKAGIWWLDPAGAGILSLYIIYDWASTCFENIMRLSGEGADRKLYKKLLYLAYRFSPVVDGFKNLVAYHAGDSVWVEFDLLLNEQTRLNRSHDVAETLQYCAEGLNEVDRAFVMTDYSSEGPTGHAADAERMQ